MKIINRLSLRRLLIIFTVTILLQILSVVILLLPQVSGGYFDSQIVCTEARRFDTLTYAVTDDTIIDFTDGGYVVPIFLQNSPYALALFGDGSIQRGEISSQLPECILVLSEQDYTSLMGSMELQTSPENTLRLKAEYMLPSLLANSPVIYTLIGPQYFGLAVSQPSLILTANAQPTLITAQTETFLSNPNYVLSILSLVLQYCALLGLILIITNANQNRLSQHHILRKSLAPVRWIVISLAAASLALPQVIDNLYVSISFNVFAFAYSCYLIFFKCKVKPVQIHFQPAAYFRAILPALISGLFIYTGITLRLPQATLEIASWPYLILSTITAAFWLCFFSFSYLYYELSTRFSSRNAYLMIMTLGVTVLGAGMYLSGVTWPMILVNTLIFGSLNILILSLLAIRTKHSLIPATAWVLALIIRQLLIL